MDLFNKCTQYTAADDVKKQGLYPYFHALESKQDIEVVMEGKRRIMLGSNNYLGLTVAPDVIEAGIDMMRAYGTGCSGSRFLNGTLKLHLELEKELAQFLRKEAVMTFSTGFQTNLGIISTLVGKNDYMVCDRDNHASIYDGCKLSYGKMVRYRHNDMASLEQTLKDIPESAGILIITDGVFQWAATSPICPTSSRSLKNTARASWWTTRTRSASSAKAAGGARTTSARMKSTSQWHVFEIAGKPRRFYGGGQDRRQLRDAQLAPLYLFGFDSAVQLRDGAGGAAALRGAPRAG
jgi:hypothetical protein